MNILATKDDVKLLLEDMTSTEFDALLDSLLVGVSRKLELACNRSLFRKTYVELHDGGKSVIYVTAPPIAEITSIIYANNMDFANGTVLGTSEYILDPMNRKNCIYSTWGMFLGGIFVGRNTLKITYVGGFDPADFSASDYPMDYVQSLIPEEVRSAVASQVAYMFKNRKTLGLNDLIYPHGVAKKVTTQWFLPEIQDVISSLRIKNTW